MTRVRWATGSISKRSVLTMFKYIPPALLSEYWLIVLLLILLEATFFYIWSNESTIFSHFYCRFLKSVRRNFNQSQNRSEISTILWLVEKDFRSFFIIRVDWYFLWHYSYFSDIEFILLHLLWQLIHWLGVLETPIWVWEQIGVSWSKLFHPFLIHPVTKSINQSINFKQ